MRLVDLNPQFVSIAVPGRVYRHVDEMAEAHGIEFDCPGCGNHRILAWFVGVPADEVPGPGRWTPGGTGMVDLWLSPSINLPTGCRWHGWVRGGEVTSA